MFKHHASSLLTIFGAHLPHSRSFLSRNTFPYILFVCPIVLCVMKVNVEGAALLQSLKETGMRIGEAWNLKWIDIDFVNSTLSITPEKGSHARMFKASNKLLAMINLMPKKSAKIFGTYELRGYRSSFVKQRKRTARKLQNPRINQITFHTFRHWKATMEYHKTKDILHVMRLLGHKTSKTP